MDSGKDKNKAWMVIGAEEKEKLSFVNKVYSKSGDYQKNIHTFSEDAATIKTHLSQRGANEATKYFLIPRELRENLNFDENVKCQKIDTETRSIFIFVVDKNEKEKKDEKDI